MGFHFVADTVRVLAHQFLYIGFEQINPVIAVRSAAYLSELVRVFGVRKIGAFFEFDFAAFGDRQSAGVEVFLHLRRHDAFYLGWHLRSFQRR